MNSFRCEEGQFWLDDQPLFVHAGEFHYFRTPVDQWTHRLRMLQDAGFNTVATYIPWLWHEPQPELIDLDGHTHPMRNLAGFLDLATEMGFYIIPRPGPYIMAETINEGIPPWVFSQYPQVALIGQDGMAQNIVSYLHPDFLACVDGWYQAVFTVLTPRQITRGGKILLIQLDNEMGMLQWVRNLLDFNPDTLARFADWLRDHYDTRLHQSYPPDNLVEYLSASMTQPGLPQAALVIEDYRRFYRAYLREYMTFLWQRAQTYGMETPPVVNIHGFGNGGKTFPIGLSQLVEVMALDGMMSATDVYPLFIGEGNFHQLLLVNEMTKALQNPQQPLFSIEFQAGGNLDFGSGQSSLYDLHSRLCISCGMRAINHYLFFDGENDPLLSPVKRHNWGQPVRKDGTPRRHYARYGKLSQVLAAYGTELVLSRPKTVTTIGFLIDDYMTEVNTAATHRTTDILTHQRDIVLFDFVARGLALTHRPFNALELSRASVEVAQTPHLWVFMEKQCDVAVQEKLVMYVRQGGNLILIGRLCEETYDHTPCTIVRDALGVQSLQSDPPFTPTRIQAFGHSDVPASFLQVYTGTFDETFATTIDGQIVGFVKHLGLGKVMVFGAALGTDTLEDLDIVNQMANSMGCPPLFMLSDWADVRLSEGDDGSFLFINNYQDDPIKTTIAADGVALLGGHLLTLLARRGVILPLDWKLKPGIVIHYLTSECIEVKDEESRLTLKTDQPEFFAEVSFYGYECDDALIVERVSEHRLKLHGRNGILEFYVAPTTP
jgi:beta-galactosidase